MQNNDNVFAEAKRLYDLGFAIHWLHPKSKRPVEMAWTTGPRKTWDYLERTYRKGFNVGVRLGEPSKIANNFLAVIDVDVKAEDAKHAKEIQNVINDLVPVDTLPIVKSGRGNGSRHYYVLTTTPVKPQRVWRSPDMVKVHMPSAKPSKKELEALTEEELAKGLRLRPAAEIAVMGDGQQVVLPPSIHPDTGKNYAWQRIFNGHPERYQLDLTPKLKLFNVDKSGEKSPAKIEDKVEDQKITEFEVQNVDLGWLPVHPKIIGMITKGEGVEDRSAMLLPVCSALHKAGLDRNEILSVLTNPNYFLGKTAYDHAQTKDRNRAAQWVWKYTLKKVLEESSAERMFREPIKEVKEVDVELQSEEFEDLHHWTEDLDRTEKGKPRATFKNAKLVITNSLDEFVPLIGRNEFAGNDYWLEDVPWGYKKGQVVSDAAILDLKDWCVRTRGIEFTVNTLNEVVMHLASLNKWHPVRDYLNALTWDGVPRISTWLKDYAFAKAPEPYLSDISRKTLVAMVKRVMQPGCKFDHVLILEGNQGAGKSSLVRALAGDEWFSDTPLKIGDKDGIMEMQSKWVIELGELSTMSKTDVDLLKAFITQRHDRMRPPYGRRTEEYPRQSIFIGTTNNDSYLKDPTGSRRFWPVRVGDNIDWTHLEKVRDQLFAEAFAYWSLEEPLYLENDEAQAQAKDEQIHRTITDEWASIIRDILNSETWLLEEFELKDLASKMDQVGAQKLSASDVQRISNALRLLGYERHRHSKRNDRRWVWKKKTPVS